MKINGSRPKASVSVSIWNYKLISNIWIDHTSWIRTAIYELNTTNTSLINKLSGSSLEVIHNNLTVPKPVQTFFSTITKWWVNYFLVDNSVRKALVSLVLLKWSVITFIHTTSCYKGHGPLSPGAAIPTLFLLTVTGFRPLGLGLASMFIVGIAVPNSYKTWMQWQTKCVYSGNNRAQSYTSMMMILIATSIDQNNTFPKLWYGQRKFKIKQ